MSRRPDPFAARPGRAGRLASEARALGIPVRTYQNRLRRAAIRAAESDDESDVPELSEAEIAERSRAEREAHYRAMGCRPDPRSPLD